MILSDLDLQKIIGNTNSIKNELEKRMETASIINIYTLNNECIKIGSGSIDNLKKSSVINIADDFLNLEDKFDYITWFMPFITANPHKKWGLPMKYFQPEKMLMHAHESLNDGGAIFVVNQGEAEYWLQKKLCEDLGIPYKEIGLIESEYSLYKLPRYAMLIF